MTLLRKLLGLATVLAVFSATTPAMAERRSALVIGNSGYLNAAHLPNPVSDAQAVAVKLESLGFSVVHGYDLDYIGMNAAIREFAAVARQSDINLLFYAGHGIAVDGVNYLIPVDARLSDSTALDFEAVSVDFITRQMSYSDSANLVLLDACRDNPLKTELSRSVGTTRAINVSDGLAEMRTPATGKGLAIAFSTSPGEVALDGRGVNSPFTTALLRHISAENTDISVVLSRVVGDVWADTEQQQRPWLSSSLTGAVMLNTVTRPAEAAEAADGAPLSAMAMLDEQKMLFDMARDSGALVDYQAYLDTFPDGLFANNARRTIQKLQSDSRQASVSPRDTVAKAPINRAMAIQEFGPLILPATLRVRGLPASEASEAALDLDRQKKGEIQSRLNAAGANVGGVDGVWGNKTRTGIRFWQTTNGLPVTGYLNTAHLEMLVSQTEGKFQPFVIPVRAVRTAAPKKRRTASAPRRTSTARTTRSRSDPASSAAVGAFVGALIGSSIRK